MDTPPPFENDHYQPSPSEPQPKGDAPPRKWYRFTLWKVVLAFVLLGFVFAYLRYTHWGYVLSENITRVGRSFGMVERRDPSKIYVSAVRPLGQASWEWSVELPPGQPYSICYRIGPIPVSGDVDEIDNFDVVGSWSDTFMVDFKIESIGGAKGLVKEVHLFDRRFLTPRTIGTGWSALGIPDWKYGEFQRDAISMKDGVQAFEQSEKIVLLRQWKPHSRQQDELGDYYQDGIMIWIEPAPANRPWNSFTKKTAGK